MRDEADALPGTRLIGCAGSCAAAAGAGAADMDETVTGYVGFRRTWLERHALDPAQCSVIGVMGESMRANLAGELLDPGGSPAGTAGATDIST